MNEGSKLFTSKAFVVVLACSLMGAAGITTALASKQMSSGRDSGPQVTLYVSPRERSITNDGEFTVDVRVNAAGKSVNAIDAELTYDSDKVEVLGIDASQSAFTIDAKASYGQGKINIERGQIGNVTGDQLVAKVRMRRTVQTGRTFVSVASTSSVIESSTSTDVLKRENGATLSFKR